MEKLIVNQVDLTLIDNPLHINQHGFQKNKSTDTAISATVNYIEKHIYNNKTVLGVFLDIQAAFDTILPETIKHALLQHNIDTNIVNWYYNYISHRNIYTEQLGVKASGTIGIGFQQGGVCSAKFWIKAFNKALEIINQENIMGIGFADDCGLLIQNDNLNHAVKTAQKIIDELIHLSLIHI